MFLNKLNNTRLYATLPKKEAKQHFNSWWEEHTTIDINAVRGQETSFNALVSILKEKKELTLLGEEVQEWRFLARLFTEFINEFNNFNHSLAIKYSNYYHTSKPLVLSENDSSFNLTNINFDNLAKFIPLSSKNVLALTVKFNIMYEVKFKELQVRDSISGLIVVINDLVAVKHMQADLKDYFVTFIDILFAKQNYSMIDRHNSDFNDVANVPDAVWNIIRTELNRLNITFFSKVVPYGNLPSLYKLTDNISKQYASVLLWAGEGYKPDKLTWQNFLYFFQRVQFPNGLISEGKYYVKANIASLNSCDFMIENLPLQNDKSEIVLKKPFKILMEKEPVDRKLTQFSQLIMDFWHYYKLETFNDKLVFHMSQVNFNALKQTIDSFASERLEFSNIELIFSSIFDYFNKRRTATIIADTHFSIWLPELHTFNLIKKSNSIIIEWFRKKVENVENLQIKINFGYNNFGYSFVPRLSIKDNNIHTGEYLRLDTFEFKIE